MRAFFCSFTPLEDTTPPVLTCPATVVETVELGVTSVVVTFGNPTVEDNSGSASLVSVSPASGSLFTVGVTSVTFTYQDAAGNEASCTFSVVVSTGKTCMIKEQEMLYC